MPTERVWLSPEKNSRNANKIVALFRNTNRQSKISKILAENYSFGDNIEDLSGVV